MEDKTSLDDGVMKSTLNSLKVRIFLFLCSHYIAFLIIIDDQIMQREVMKHRFNLTFRLETLWKKLEVSWKTHWNQTWSINLKPCLEVLLETLEAFPRRRLNESLREIGFQSWSSLDWNGRRWYDCPTSDSRTLGQIYWQLIRLVKPVSILKYIKENECRVKILRDNREIIESF